jgi:hypothetical protein
VDRLTTGRRHARAGSVTVTELISRQSTPTHCTDSSPATPDEDSTDVIPVVLQATHRREPARAAQVAKLASLGVAGVVLCGAVAISSFVTNQRRESSESAMRPSVQITGEQALLPDVLDRTLPAESTTSAPVKDTPPPAAERPPATPAPAGTQKAPPVDTGTSASESTVSVGAASDLELVREFYENLPDSPVTAFKLLSTDGLDMDLDDFLSSWSMVSAIDSVDVAQRADGVLAMVRMRLTDGGQLRVEQLLTVAESPRRIVGVQLLSAQRH